MRSGGKGEEKESGESDEELEGGVEEGMWREGGGEVVISFEAKSKKHCKEAKDFGWGGGTRLEPPQKGGKGKRKGEKREEEERMG